MSINVYWAVYDSNDLFHYYAPEMMIKHVHQDVLESEVARCPGFQAYCKNRYVLRSPFEYQLTLTQDGVFSDMYDQRFFDRYVVARNKKVNSFNWQYIFYSDAPSLKVDYAPPAFTFNKTTSTTTAVCGTYDIGKWFRAMEYGFLMNDNQAACDRGDIFAEIKFHTDEKVNLIRFDMTDELYKLAISHANAGSYNRKPKLLSWYYKKAEQFNAKARVINAIERSLNASNA